MDVNTINVQLELETTIEDNGQVETNTTNESGLFHQRNNFDVLTYEEKLEDGTVVKNMVTLQPDKVSVKRSGPVSMHQKFELDQITENVFQHPHGHIHMETTTHSIDYRPLGENANAEVRIDYTVKLNGQEKRKHTLSLILKEAP